MKITNSKTALFLAAYLAGLVSLAIVGFLYADYTIKSERHKEVLNDKFHTDVTYISLPQMNMTMTSSVNQASGRVRINLSLEVDKKYATKVEDYAPHISESIANYMRKLDLEDVSRPGASKWLREHLLQIANKASATAPIIDVIFEQFLVF